MCGISGLFVEAERVDLTQQIESCLRVIRHRGPDGQGVRQGRFDQCVAPGQPANWALGHVRLAILDLSDAGLQPMASPDKKCWVTYNGEIYNFQDLRGEHRHD